MNHIWFRDKSGVPFAFVKNGNGEVKTVYVRNQDFEQYRMKPSIEAQKWGLTDHWADIPKPEALKLYEASQL